MDTDKHVAFTAHRADMFAATCRVAQLLPQVADVDIDAAIERRQSSPEDVLGQAVAR
jgi:hypothetical protein